MLKLRNRKLLTPVLRPSVVALSLCAFAAASAQAAPNVAVRLPERFRVLTDQRFDVRVEASGLGNLNAALTLFIANKNVTNTLGTPEITTNNDNDPATLDKAWTFRNVTLPKAGVITVEARVNDASGNGSDRRQVGVQEFKLNGNKNVILLHRRRHGHGLSRSRPHRRARARATVSAKASSTSCRRWTRCRSPAWR